MRIRFDLAWLPADVCPADVCPVALPPYRPGCLACRCLPFPSFNNIRKDGVKLNLSITLKKIVICYFIGVDW